MEVNIKSSTAARSLLTRLGKCEVCGMQEAKYTCPKCEVKTCCLNCSRIHKTELNCSGQRDRTKFISINKFTNLDLLSDYVLLEEISRSIQSSRKKFGKRFSNHSHHLIQLKNLAKSQQIKLKFLPNRFEKRRINTTFLKYENKSIFWHIEWIFVNADNLKITNEKVSQDAKLSEILSKYFEIKSELLYEKLQFYQSAGLNGVKVYLKAEEKKGNRYYEIDINFTIKDTLFRRIIIEYPTFYVVLKNHSQLYEVIDSDGEGDKGMEFKKSGNQVIQSIINAESERHAGKNLLFSEYSENELSN